MVNNKNCIHCGNSLSGQQYKFCSSKCKNSTYQNKKRREFKDITGISFQSYKGIKLKLLLILEFGGACIGCGYKKNLSALEFHHLDPNEKEFTIDVRTLSNRNIDKIRNELKKCILVCSNCHQEIHYPHLDIETLNL